MMALKNAIERNNSQSLRQQTKQSWSPIVPAKDIICINRVFIRTKYSTQWHTQGSFCGFQKSPSARDC